MRNSVRGLRAGYFSTLYCHRWRVLTGYIVRPVAGRIPKGGAVRILLGEISRQKVSL
jgi:hypothetical protein